MTYETFTQYLHDLGASHVDIQDVVMGDYEDIISKERTTLRYPCLWIETPSVSYEGDEDALREIYEGSLVVLQNGSNMDIDIQKANLNQTFLIARDILFRFCLRDNLMPIRGARLDAIATLGNDNDQGWRFGFRLDMLFDEDDVCFDDSQWNE